MYLIIPWTASQERLTEFSVAPLQVSPVGASGNPMDVSLISIAIVLLFAVSVPSFKMAVT